MMFDFETTFPSCDVSPATRTANSSEIPRFLRKVPLPEKGTRERAVIELQAIDKHINRLATRGLRPHPLVLAKRQHVVGVVTRLEPFTSQDSPLDNPSPVFSTATPSSDSVSIALTSPSTDSPGRL